MFDLRVDKCVRENERNGQVMNFVTVRSMEKGKTKTKAIMYHVTKLA